MRAKDRVYRAEKLIREGFIVDHQGRLEHREVYKQAYGPMPTYWVVYHIDGVKTNNVPENLIAMPKRVHDRIRSVIQSGKVSSFTRPQLESMIKAYVNLYKNKDLAVYIEITVCSDQIVKKEPVIKANIGRSGSSSYR